jgi:uncharacterized delta-60 repeat protein
MLRANQKTQLSKRNPLKRYIAFFQAGLLASVIFSSRLIGQAADGDLESSFNTNIISYYSSGGYVYSVAVQPDGKILFGGQFTSVGGTNRNFLARLNADGTLDSAFNPNAGSTVQCVVVQSDGRILIGGSFTAVGGTMRNSIARLTADGTVDSSFNPNANGNVSSIAVQADGKILIAGDFSSVGGMPHKCIARLNADGTVDNTPNPISPTADSVVFCIAVQSDGKILIGGGSIYMGGSYRQLARLNADWTMDNSFSPDVDGGVYNFATQPDGQILIGGWFSTVGGIPRNSMARLNADGTLDSGFNPNVDNEVYSVAVQADGQILIGGVFTNVGGMPRNHIARLNADGTVDGGFNPNADIRVYAVAVQPDGKILIGGGFTNLGGTACNCIARLLNSPASQTLSAPDNTRVQWLRSGTTPEVEQVSFELMSGDSTSWTLLGSGTRVSGGWQLTGLSLPPDGYIRARGRNTGGKYNGSSGLVQQVLAFGSVPHLAVYQGGNAITNGAGTVDFGTLFPGQLASPPIDFTISNSGPATLVLGSVTTSGDAAADYIVDVNGMAPSLDAGASTTVQVTFRPVQDGLRRATLHITSNDGNEAPFEAMLTGTKVMLDSSFNPNANNTVFSVAVQPDGKILIGGSFTNLSGTPHNRIARLNADGTVDGSFNLNASNYVRSIAVQADGKILIGGDFTSVGGLLRNYAARLNVDGTVDSNFNPSANGSVSSAAVQADGKILIGGSFTAVGGTTRNYIARLNADGTVDSNFNPSASATVNSIAVQADGKILIGGGFSMVGGTTRNFIARLNADGTVDSSFIPNANAALFTIAIQPDGKILAGGSFTNVGGMPRNYIARLNADGTVDSNFNPNANRYVYSFALQADGQILIGGSFTNVGGMPRNYIARLNADGSVDSGFNSTVNVNSSSVVLSLALQADGKVLMGGQFSGVAGVSRSCFARLLNGNASQSIAIPECTQVQWLRSGTAPEVEQVTFELMTGVSSSWTQLGSGTRASGGWQLTGLSLPANGFIRARGRTTGGDYNGGSGLIEQVVAYSLPDTLPPALTCPPDVTVITDPGRCSASGVALGTPTASDNSGTVTVSSNAPAQFPLGTNTVIWTATDPSGNSNTCSQQVIVLESAPPTVTCPASMTVQATVFSGMAVNFPLTLNGGCSPLTVYCAPPSGSTLPIGNTIVTAMVVDGCGVTNRSSFTVTVLAPPVTLSSSMSNGGRLLSWPFGVLQASDRVNGIYTNVPNAASPFTITPTGVGQYYYRVKVQ